MSDMNQPSSSTPNAVPPSAPPSALASGGAFCFTDPGCRTEVRLGALIILGAVFLWLFFGPTFCSRLYLIGAPLLLIGIPIQAFQGRAGRPGYPWKLGLAIALGGAFMWPDLRYREVIGGPVHVQEIAPLLLAAGAWILAWWPVASFRSSSSQTPVPATEKVSA